VNEEDNDEEENEELKIYWRFDEGRGNKVEDLSNYQIDLEADNDIDWIYL